ncbi:MAG: 16S rRNA (guanine(527)-N(7))-methyltransferase RsmG [Kiloniellaceae bacterium]
MGGRAGGGVPGRPAPLGPEGFRAATDVSRETLARLKRYAALLEKWNRAINLVGRDSLADLWRRHMLDSAQLLPLLPPPPAGRPRVVLDLGSGAGFPGLVLAVLGAGEVHLVECDRKKAAFLREAAAAAEAEIAIHNERIERLPPFPADVVTARALAPLPRLLDYAAPFLRPGERGSGGVAIFPIGRGVDRELTDSVQKWKMRAEVFSSRSDPAAKIVRLSRLAREENRP